MSAEVEVIIDRHEDVLTIPVAAVVETEEGDFCWVKTAEGAKRRSLQLGDTDDSFIVVKAGLKEGDEVVLNPLAFIEEAQTDALKPPDEAKSSKPSSREISNASKPPEPSAAKPPGDSKQQESQPKTTGAQIIKLADKNDDGVLTIDEYAEKDRHTFGTTDTNKDGRVDASEFDAAIKRLEEAKPK